jgi:hypothetical protein
MQRAATATQPSPEELCRQIAALSAAAIQFVARDRGEALIQKWLSRRDVEGASENRMLAMMADAMLLGADLVLSQPAANGTTAFDRLARSRAGDPSARAAVAALRQARFRLLRLEGPARSAGDGP